MNPWFSSSCFVRVGVYALCIMCTLLRFTVTYTLFASCWCNLILQVKNFILLGDIHKSIYFFSWKEPQLSLLAKDFGSLDCFATEFLIDGSTLSLMVSDEQKNVQVWHCPLFSSFLCSWHWKSCCVANFKGDWNLWRTRSLIFFDKILNFLSTHKTLSI